MLMTGDDSDYARKVNASVPMVAATAVKENRLTFTWLDGDVQLVSYFAYISYLLFWSVLVHMYTYKYLYGSNF